MKAELVQAASKVITSPQILVNMVSRRVRQLTLGHRPLVVCAPGLREADIALTEIASGKLTFESTFGQNGTAEPPARIVLFEDGRRRRGGLGRQRALAGEDQRRAAHGGDREEAGRRPERHRTRALADMAAEAR